jgi:hypothetical protein
VERSRGRRRARAGFMIEGIRTNLAMFTELLVSHDFASGN